MAITGPSSYIPCINRFLPHWAEANAAQPGNPTELTVRVSSKLNTVRRSDLIGWRDVLQGFVVQIEDEVLNLDLARARNRELREAMHERLNQFNRIVRANLTGTVYLDALPKVPPITVGEFRICLAFQEMNMLWKSVNAAAAAGNVPGLDGPLTLRGDDDQASFENGIATLRASYAQILQLEQQLKITRMRRNLVQDNIYATLRGYRATVLAQFSGQDPVVLTLPRLTPAPKPGTRPDPAARTESAVIPLPSCPGDSHDRDAEGPHRQRTSAERDRGQGRASAPPSHRPTPGSPGDFEGQRSDPGSINAMLPGGPGGSALHGPRTEGRARGGQASPSWLV